MSDQPSNEPVAKYFSGTADEDQVNASISKAWKEILKDPEKRSAIAKELGANPESLNPDVPPYQAQINGSGLTGAEVLIAFGAAFVLGWAKGAGEEAGKETGKASVKGIKNLWDKYFYKEVSPPGSKKLGKEKLETENEDT
jgi:hypothetical protein